MVLSTHGEKQSEYKDYNLRFLKNRELKSRGYVFLRNIYETLGLSITEESRVTDWNRENCIKYSITDSNDGENSEMLLDFNVEEGP